MSSCFRCVGGGGGGADPPGRRLACGCVREWKAGTLLCGRRWRRRVRRLWKGEAAPLLLIPTSTAAAGCSSPPLTSAAAASVRPCARGGVHLAGSRCHAVGFCCGGGTGRGSGVVGWRCHDVPTVARPASWRAQALGNVNYFTTVSNHTQDMLGHLLRDEAWCAGHLAECHRLLRFGRNIVTGTLDDLELPYHLPSAGMFVWMDLRSLLRRGDAGAAERSAVAPSVAPRPRESPLLAFVSDPVGWAAETELTSSLYHDSGLIFTPGRACHAAEPGYYRCCFAYPWSVTTIAVAMERLRRFVQRRRQGGADVGGEGRAAGTAHAADVACGGGATTGGSTATGWMPPPGAGGPSGAAASGAGSLTAAPGAAGV